MRFLLIILAIWIVVMILRYFLQQERREAKRKLPTATDTVKCARCGLHLPRDEAIASGGQWYCSERHRLEDQG